jgi:hypothetical protein
MVNLRILNINAADSRTIKVRFSAALAEDIGQSNILIESEINNVPDIEVLRVFVRNEILIIDTLPHTPFARYKVTFRSTNAIRFRSADNRQFLIEDGRSNVVKILGAENDYNPTRDQLVNYLGGADSVYDLSRETTVRDILNQTSNLINKARADIRQAKNSNYLEVKIKDERKTRRFGPWDRLLQESAFEILRVGLTSTDENLQGIISYDYFPREPITLQREVITGEELSLGFGSSTYNDLILTLRRSPVTKVTSIQIRYESGGVWNYEINSLGYRIRDPKYDPTYGRRLITLEDNQIKLNDDIKDDTTFIMPGGLDKIIISYEYKSLGKVINENSVEVVEVIQQVREVSPALVTMFSVDNAPIVTATDGTPVSGGIAFHDPYSETPFRSTHRAFTNEIPFREGGLPSRPGDYSVDYESGRVFVYGAIENDGTGYFPPTMTYYYRKTYIPRLDYTYVPESRDLVASPLRELIGQSAKINYLYEQTLVPGIDYKANVHTETRNERIENRLASIDSIYTENSPVTDVFKIFNETTGEIYKLRRFNDYRVWFDYQTAPRIDEISRERCTFDMVINEPLILESEFFNTYGIRILKFKLQNENIISATEDVIGSSFNTSVSFSQNDIFEYELYYDFQESTETINTNRLLVGQYQIDYRSGVVYVGVTPVQSLKVGFVSYRRPVVSPENSYVITVSDIYTSINSNFGTNKVLDYESFNEGEITPISTLLDFSDERFIAGDVTNPFVYDNGIITVNDDIKTVRGIYDAYDLNNNITPTNFADTSTWNNNIITLDNVGIEKNVRTVVGLGLVVTVPFISPGIVLGVVRSVARVSDHEQLIDGLQTVTGNTITLSGSSGAGVGDIVDVTYTVVLNGSSTPIIDYNRGDIFVDYTYLADEIIISYEWGDNVIDWRESNVLEENDTYYVTYLIGALRNSLLQNFGSLVRVPELQVFDEELEREVYRDLIQGALQTFTQGPTIPAMKQLISQVTQIDPRIREVTWWSLSVSYLEKLSSEVLGSPYLTAGCFDQGIAIKERGDGVTLPISNNLRLEEGTLEMCVIPDWNGIDNDATLTFYIEKDGYVLSSNQIYIGTTSFHPELDSSNRFTINRTDTQSPEGVPALIFARTGVFIYYDTDNKQWKILAKDAPGPNGSIYSGNIRTTGDFYDVKFIPSLGELSDVLRSDLENIDFEFYLDGYDAASPDGYWNGDGYTIVPGYSFDGIQFMSDDRHYFFDFGLNENQNRFSLYKDGRGYLVFEVWDEGGLGNFSPERRSVYQVSSDIKDWTAGAKHHIATSWILNSTDDRDEMHLYIDGFETPNLAKYGNVPAIASSERFRTVVPEEVVGTITKKSIVGNDLITNQGSDVVSSETFDFQAEGIVPGDTIEILEQTFATYTIISVLDNELTLSSPMPATLSDARFSVNPIEFIVGTEIDVYPNIGVFTRSGGVETEIPGVRADIPSYSIERNTLNQRVLKVLGNLDVGDSVLVKTFGLNHRRCRNNIYLWSENSVLKTALPPPINLDDVIIRTVALPLTAIGPDNATLVGSNFVAILDGYTQPSNFVEGRYFDVRVTGDNTDWTTPVEVTINGDSTGGPTETIIFLSPGKKTTTYKWLTFNSIVVEVKPILTTQNATSIEIKDTYSITEPAGNNIYPVIRYSYRTLSGGTLQSLDGGTIVSDSSGYFPMSEVGNLMSITSPVAAAGLYEIVEKIDNTTVRLDSAVGVPFTNGSYESFSISIGRSGFANGFFFLEKAGFANVEFILPAGNYEIDYATYLKVPFRPLTSEMGIIGNDISLQMPAKSVIDEFRILNRQLTDTRIGETIGANEESITTGATKFAPYVTNQDTLALFHFEELPPENDSYFYKFANKEYIQSGKGPNSRFGHSVVIRDKGLVFDNKGYLDTSGEGLIEFWVSPRFDTYNDPNVRVYFDASSNVIEEVTSITNGRVKVSGRVSDVIYVRLITDTKLQGTEYFNGGRIDTDGQTIILNTPLPYQKTPVKVSYIPTGVNGDRITIVKDKEGYLNLTVNANGSEFQTRQQIFWPRNTWHRIRASFKFNRRDNRDELRLFVDGEEKGSLLFGQGNILFGTGLIWGQIAVGGALSQSYIADINFRDSIQQFSLGQDYAGHFGAEARFDNLKISDKSYNPLIVAGQSVDVYWNTNVDYLYPSIEDSYTTLLWDFDQYIEKTEDFAVIRDPSYGIFNFDIDIIDSFDIVTGDERVQTVLEALINALKPAQSKVGINYVK